MRSKVVSAEEIQRVFNENQYYERMQAGEFRSEVVKQNRRRTGGRNVRNTMSQTVVYRDSYGRRVAVVHQYRKRDGSLGGSGKPDPKLVIHEGTMYLLAEGEDWDMPEW